MSAVEAKEPGFFTKGVKEKTSDSEWVRLLCPTAFHSVPPATVPCLPPRGWRRSLSMRNHSLFYP
jgi:hypothetical protein